MATREARSSGAPIASSGVVLRVLRLLVLSLLRAEAQARSIAAIGRIERGSNTAINCGEPPQVPVTIEY